MKGITKMQHFEFRNDLDGQVSVRTSCDSESKVIKVLLLFSKTTQHISALDLLILCHISPINQFSFKIKNVATWCNYVPGVICVTD